MFTVEIEKWIPRFLTRDRNCYALAKGIEAGLNALNRIAEAGLACLSDVETMPEWRLDELAWEYAADWYGPQAEIPEKRSQIAGAFAFYNRLGTVYAVKKAVEATFGAGRVEEWYQYNGTPYHFRIFADGSSMSGAGSLKLQRMVQRVQNVRSVLDQICFTGESEAAALITVGAAVTGAQGEIHALARED